MADHENSTKAPPPYLAGYLAAATFVVADQRLAVGANPFSPLTTAAMIWRLGVIDYGSDHRLTLVEGVA